MKILFIASGNKGNINSLVRSQGISLLKEGINTEYFPVKGKGITGYLRNVPILRHLIIKEKYDILHAHYSFSGMIASFTYQSPLVVSLMGSDAYISPLWRLLIRLIARFSWRAVIVKSQNMKDLLGMSNSHVIPNGVNTTLFRPIDRENAKSKISFSEKKSFILFASDTERPEKNFALADQAFNTIKDDNLELLTLSGEPSERMPLYLNAASVVLITSLWEGSPNIVKEAMSCNCPIVATDVGDIRWLLGNEPGHFLTTFDPEDVAEKIKLALEFSEKVGRTNGRQRIIDLGLDSETIAKRIIKVYEEVLFEESRKKR